MLNPENLNWGAKTAFFWLGVGAILTVWSFYRLPEPKDRTCSFSCCLSFLFQ